MDLACYRRVGGLNSTLKNISLAPERASRPQGQVKCANCICPMVNAADFFFYPTPVSNRHQYRQEEDHDNRAKRKSDHSAEASKRVKKTRNYDIT